MNVIVFLRWSLLLLLTLSVHGQEPPKDFSDPVALLTAVAKNYARGVDTFRMESIAEISSNADLRHEWRKVYQTAIKGPGSLYRIETRSPYGSFVQDFDGVNEWIYQVEGKIYVQRPLPENWPGFSSLFFAGNSEVREAWSMRSSLEFVAAQYKRAVMLPQETITVGDHNYLCYVVHGMSDDSSAEVGWNSHSDTTLWIDKTALVFRKQVHHSSTYARDGINPQIRFPFTEDSTIVYPAADLDVQIDPSVFRFVPPAEAKQVAHLEADRFVAPAPTAAPKPTMVGQLAPDVSFVAADGGKIELAYYRGKPLLLDIWATWCGPCLASIPSLEHIYTDVRCKGVAVVTLDEDQTAEIAADYLARHNYPWANYHDHQWEISKAFKNEGIPLTVLINARGEIVYYANGVDESAILKAIAALEPRTRIDSPVSTDSPALSRRTD
jgi:thiol-disulfide isomerase/thioredoxin